MMVCFLRSSLLLYMLLALSLLNCSGMSAFLSSYNPVSIIVIIAGFSRLMNLSKSSVLLMLPEATGML